MHHFQNNFVKCLGIIYLIRNTQLCKLWLWHMSRFSTRFCGGSPSGSLSGSRGVQSPSSCTELGPIRCWPDCSASRSQPTQANGVQLFFFPGIWGSWDQTLLLTGSPGRQAAVTTAPAPGPEGNTLTVASLWQISKTWPSPLAIFVILYLCAILWWCK